jgi:endoglucanase
MAAHAKRSGRATRLMPAALAIVAVVAGVGVVAATRGAEPPAEQVSGKAAVHRSSAPVTGSPPPSPVLGEATTSPPAARKAPPRAAAGPLARSSFYVDPTGAATRQVRDLESAGRRAEAQLIRKIADRPAATWFADSAPGYGTRARRLVTAAAKAGKLPVLAMYNIPHRDCSGHSAGGASGADAYRAYVASMAEAMRGHRAVVVLEPDAVAQAVEGCLDEGGRQERFTLLGEAIDTLRKNPELIVYLDAGNPSWITDPGRMAAALEQAGVGRSHGFALNVANFETTAANIAYGTALSKLLGGARFVVDTSRNGNGPAARGPNGTEHWCNPVDRRLGEPPTTRTGHALVDAYLWIKRPGESDGACGNGAPPAGQWWPDYALRLAR